LISLALLDRFGKLSDVFAKLLPSGALSRPIAARASFFCSAAFV
jgi:hypothetical protein